MMKPIAFLAGISFTLVNLDATAAPTVNIETEYYSVEGDTAAEIRRSLNRNSPIRYNGKNFDGLTNWYVKWRFWWEKSENSCQIDRVTTTVDIKYTMPRLENADSIDPSLQNKWNSYITALQNHEDEHKNIAVETAEEIEKAIANIEAADNCEELEDKANSLGHSIIEEYKEVQKQYDRDTRHGATEGAKFP